MQIKALTIDALWAWAILAGHKRVENRAWTTPHRGRIAIHAGRNASRDGEPLRLFDRLGITPPDDELRQDLRGCILGTVELFDIRPYCRTSKTPPLPGGIAVATARELVAEDLIADDLVADPWATGPWCWLLRDPVWLTEPVAVTGNVRLWTWTPESPDQLTEGTAPTCHTSAASKPSSSLFST